MTNLNSITEAQRQARERFDLDAAMAALPPPGPFVPTANHRGQAGVRLRAHLVADISDDLLREFARDTLGAQRCSEQYLDALRVVLGNQADAERYGYALEMNQRVSFASPHVMRQIIGQMQAAGVSFGSVIGLGKGRSQVVQCYWRDPGALTDATPPEVAEEALERMYWATEAADDARHDKADDGAALAPTQWTGWHFTGNSELTIADADVPY
jgi:hypothetical protein